MDQIERNDLEEISAWPSTENRFDQNINKSMEFTDGSRASVFVQ